MDAILLSAGITARVRSAAVSLRMNSVPLLYVHVESTRLDEDFGGAVRMQSRISLGGRLEGTLIGFETNRGRDDEQARITLIATVMDTAFEEWLGQSAREASPKLLVYQRKKDETPRGYFERLLDQKVDWSTSEALEQDNVFRAGACLWRTEDATNLRFLSEVIDFIRLRRPAVEGWYAISDARKPLRVITRNEHVLQMDADWWGLEGLELDTVVLPARGIAPDRYRTDEFTLKRYFWLVGEAEEIKLEALTRFVSKGPPGPAAGLPLTGGVEQCMMGPGPARFGGETYFAHEVQYEVRFEVDSGSDNAVLCTAHLSEFRPSEPASPFHDVRLPAQFSAWREKDDVCVITELTPSGEDGAEAQWNLHEDGKIFTHYHTPSWARNEHRGFYGTLESGDDLFVELRGGELPTLIGARQTHAKELQKSSISMHAERDGLLTCPPTTCNDCQYGYYIKEDTKITGRTKVNTVDSELMRINENIDIMPDLAKVYKPMNYKGNVWINPMYELNVGAGSMTREVVTPQTPDAISMGTALDGLQTGLDVVGLVPGVGEVADGINALISLARGDYAVAALSAAAMIPFAGWGATAGKLGRRAKVLESVAASRKARQASNFDKYARKEKVIEAVTASRQVRKESEFTIYASKEQQLLYPENATTARNFYKEAGVPDAQIDGHIAGLDLSKPVRVETVQESQIVYQWQKDGKTGRYFTPGREYTPTELGVSPHGRVQQRMEIKKGQKVMKSTARSVPDKWSDPTKAPVGTTGGGLQYYVPNNGPDYVGKR